MFSKHEIKKAAWTVGIVALSAYAISRLLPGLAARVGLIGRPIFPQQGLLPEPIGQIPLIGPRFQIAPYGLKLWYGAPATTTTPASTTTAPE